MALIPENTEETPEEVKIAIPIYKLGIYQVQTTGNFDITQKCLVCDQAGHTFEECPVLNNHELLKQLHITFCSMCKRMKKKQSDSPSKVQIHAVSTESSHDSGEIIEFETDSEETSDI